MLIKLTITIILIAVLQWQDQLTTASDGNREAEKPVVFLTVSSLAKYPDIEERLLELNWYNVPSDSENATVRLYAQNPTETNLSNYLVRVEMRLHREDGYFLTDVQFPRHSFSQDNLTNSCLGFWIAFVQRDRIVSHSCLRAFPNWMHEMRTTIGNASLLQIAIPGTHNAGSYSYYDSDDDTILKKYLVTQEESVWNQLVYGVRYIDLRVSYERVNDASDVFWITHGVFRTDIPLSDVLRQVKAFLNATQEIVIMDFHRFVNGFNGRRSSERHRSLIAYLEEELSEIMVPTSFSSWTTLEEMWQTNRRLYVGYAASNADRLSSPYLFPAVRHLWGDKDKINDLFAFLNASVCMRRQSRLTSAMAQLTPTTGGAIFDVYGGLRKMASDVNRHLTVWFRDLWSQCTNIVSTDFFLGPKVYVTVRSAIRRKLYHKSIDREMDVNWYNVDCSSAKTYWIGLFRVDPITDGILDPKDTIKDITCPEGYYRTPYRFHGQMFPRSNTPKRQCLGFWAAIIQSNQIVSSSCLSTNPNWMYEMRLVIGKASLDTLMIPGTHNSGSYSKYNMFQDSIYHRYIWTQEESVFDQLVYGIRYLDLRVFYEKGIFTGFRTKLSITHGIYRIDFPTLVDILYEVKSFVDITNEIVILDFHRVFKGMEQDLLIDEHKEVVRVIRKILGQYMVPNSFNASSTLNELWSQNYRVYVSYPVEIKEYPLHPGIKQLWANVDDIQALQQYINKNICSVGSGLYVAMVHLTPTTFGAMFDVYNGLRDMADLVNHNVSAWLRSKWSCANIVAIDYFMGNDLIQLSIENNKNRFYFPVT